MKKIATTSFLLIMCFSVALAQERNRDSKFDSIPVMSIGTVDRPPAFIYGEDSLFHFLQAQFQIPDKAKSIGINGIMFFSFVVEPDSSISDVKAIAPKERQLGYGLEEECMRVIRLTTGMWKPAVQYGESVRCVMRMPYKFKNKPDTSLRAKEKVVEPRYLDSNIYFSVDKQAEFMFGIDSLMGFVEHKFVMPPIAQDLAIIGTIYIQFVVEQDGSISQAKAIAPRDRQLGYGLEKECIRVIRLTSGKWRPGRRAGKPVRTHWRLPFRIDNSTF